MQAGFISLLGFWVGGYGGYEAVVAEMSHVIIDGMNIAGNVTVNGLNLSDGVVIDGMLVSGSIIIDGMILEA